MPFMQPQVYETDYMEVDGPMGTEIVPCDVDNFDVPEIVNFPKQGDSEDNRAIPGPLALYCENTWAWTIERKHGWVGRLSAPGYMDRTDWCAFETEKGVRDYLTATYELDEDGADA